MLSKFNRFAPISKTKTDPKRNSPDFRGKKKNKRKNERDGRLNENGAWVLLYLEWRVILTQYKVQT